MTSSHHKNNVSSARTSDKKTEAKSTSSRHNEKASVEVKKSILMKNKF